MRGLLKSRRGWLMFASVAASVASYAGPASATLIVRDDFNTPGVVNGQRGGEGAWAGDPQNPNDGTPWVSANTTIGNRTQVVNVATPLGIDGVSGGNSALAVFPGSGNINNDNFLSRALGETVSNDTVFVSFLFRFEGQGVVSDNEFFSLWFSNNDTTSSHINQPNIGIKGNPSTGTGNNNGQNDIQARVRLGSEAYAPNSNVSNGSTWYIVGRLSKTVSGGIYNKFDLWVNPSYSQLVSNSPEFYVSSTVTGNPQGSLTSFNTLGFRTSGLDNSNLPFLIDRVTVGTELADVLPSPEPGGIVLIASAAPIALIVGYRRRKRATTA